MTRMSPPKALCFTAPCVSRHSNSQALKRLVTHTYTVQVGSGRVFHVVATVLWLIASRPKVTGGRLQQWLHREVRKVKSEVRKQRASREGRFEWKEEAQYGNHFQHLAFIHVIGSIGAL